MARIIRPVQRSLAAALPRWSLSGRISSAPLLSSAYRRPNSLFFSTEAKEEDQESFNPEHDPTGIEGGLNTNELPWVPCKHAPGMFLKPLRASEETGFFTMCVRMTKDTVMPDVVHLGAMDFMILSGKMTSPEGPIAGTLDPGCWTYVPANAYIKGMVAEEDVEYLANCYGPWAFLRNDHDREKAPSVFGVLASKDITKGAADNGIILVPNTLAECMQPRPRAFEGKPEPMAIGSSNEAAAIVTATAEGIAKAGKALSPHSVDTKALPWIVTPETPDVGLKIMRVSEETGTISLIVRHNGVAPPHYHLGAADFMVLSGRIGYRMGPAEGYGPGMWFYEPPGARHESTQRIGTDDLIYIANVYGPIQFDSGKDTPIAFILSWMQYKAMAEGFGSPLVKSRFENDRTLLANSDGFGSKSTDDDIHIPEPEATSDKAIGGGWWTWFKSKVTTGS